MGKLKSVNKESLLKAKHSDDIVSLIRMKYSLNDELAILRQRDTKPEEFEAYSAYVEECKKIINN